MRIVDLYFEPYKIIHEHFWNWPVFVVKNYLDIEVVLIDIEDKFNPRKIKHFTNFLQHKEFEIINTGELTYNRNWVINTVKNMHS